MMIAEYLDEWFNDPSKEFEIKSIKPKEKTKSGFFADTISAKNINATNNLMVNGVPVFTKEDMDELRQELKNQKSFIDIQTNAFTFLLKDQIKEEIEKMDAEYNRKIKKIKIKDINNFTRAIKKVIFTKKNETIVLWKDGTKTIVTCQEGDDFDKEKGFALCVIKYIFGNIAEFNNIFKAFDFDSDEPQIEPNIK